MNSNFCVFEQIGRSSQDFCRTWVEVVRAQLLWGPAKVPECVFQTSQEALGSLPEYGLHIAFTRVTERNQKHMHLL